MSNTSGERKSKSRYIVPVSLAVIIGSCTASRVLEQPNVEPPADTDPTKIECSPLDENHWAINRDMLDKNTISSLAILMGVSVEELSAGHMGSVACNQELPRDGDIINTPLFVSVGGDYGGEYSYACLESEFEPFGGEESGAELGTVLCAGPAPTY